MALASLGAILEAPGAGLPLGYHDGAAAGTAGVFEAKNGRILGVILSTASFQPCGDNRLAFQAGDNHAKARPERSRRGCPVERNSGLPRCFPRESRHLGDRPSALSPGLEDLA